MARDIKNTATASLFPQKPRGFWGAIKSFLRSPRGQQGFTLIEVLIALALLGTVGFALFEGLSTAQLGRGFYDERSGAVVAARSQIEAIKQATYDTSVTATPGPAYASLPSSRAVGGITFDLGITGQVVATEVQLVTVAASAGGEEILRLQTYKVNR